MSFAKPSEAPASSEYKFSVEENIGSLFVIEPKSEKTVDTDHGEKTVIVSTVTEIDLENPAKDSESHDDVWVFPAWIQGSIRHLIAEGGMALGRLQQDADKGKGKNAAWVLEDPDEEDIEAATAWLNARSRGKLGVDDAEKPAKGKKKKK